MKRKLAGCLLAVGLAGCASPDPSIFTLAPVPGTAIPGGPKLVELRRPGLAGYLDRSEVVQSNADFRIRVRGGDRWGEPYGDMVGRVLAEDLTSRLPGSNVFTSTGAISALADASIEVDLQRLDPDATGQVVLLMQVAVSRGRSRDGATARAVRVAVTPAGPGTADLVAAESAALGQAADQIAALLRGR